MVDAYVYVITLSTVHYFKISLSMLRENQKIFILKERKSDLCLRIHGGAHVTSLYDYANYEISIESEGGGEGGAVDQCPAARLKSNVKNGSCSFGRCHAFPVLIVDHRRFETHRRCRRQHLHSAPFPGPPKCSVATSSQRSILSAATIDSLGRLTQIPSCLLFLDNYIDFLFFPFLVFFLIFSLFFSFFSISFLSFNYQNSTSL